MAATVRENTGVALRVDGPCPGGQVGAAYVTWPDGHRSVLKGRPGVRLADLRGHPDIPPLDLYLTGDRPGFCLHFGLRGVPADARVIARLDRVLDSVPDGGLAPLWAHMSLRMTDWAIRHFTSADGDHWLDLAEQRAR
jgi:hypothetical protein